MPVIKKIWSLEDENQDLQDIDIGLRLYPIMNGQKVNVQQKLLQYLSVGIPVVCSPVGVHKEIIQEGINGLFAASNQEWIEKINLLAHDKTLREHIDLKAKKR